MKVVVAIDSLKGSLSSLEAGHSSLEGLDILEYVLHSSFVTT